MPATFAHPAAVLPFRRLTGRWLDFTALVIGSIAPDFGYYIRKVGVATYAHSPSGTVLFCLPVGLIVFGLFRILRAPLCYLLPQPHRAALMPLATTRFALTRQSIAAICLSIVLGAWTHIVCDSFTHSTGWVVQRLPAMQKVVFRIGPADFPVHQLLQHAASTLGTAVLVCAYVFWLRKRPRRALATPGVLSDRTRIMVIAALGLVAFGVAVPLGWQITSGFSGYLRFRVFAFQAALYASQVFGPLFVLAALWFYARRGQTHRGAGTGPQD